MAENSNAARERHSLRINLVAANDSDQPVLSNYAVVRVTPGLVYLDFGFIDPGVLPALNAAVGKGQKPPEQINARLAVRVALGVDTLAQLQQQIGSVLQGIQSQRQAMEKARGDKGPPGTS
jgi:hypothetical protein